MSSPKGKTTGIVLRLDVNSVVQDLTNTEQIAELQDRNISIVENLDISQKMCEQNLENQDSDKTEVKHIDVKEQSLNYAQSEYTTPYYLTNNQAKASVKCLKTTAEVITCTRTQNTSDHYG